MPVYSFESPRSVPRLAHAVATADTSYLIGLCLDKKPSIIQFHEDAINHKTEFFINSVVRQEFLKCLRKSTIINGIRELVKNDASFEARYQALLHPRPFRPSELDYTFEKIYKNHIRKDDVGLLLDSNLDIAAQEAGFLDYAKINYYETNDKEVSFDDLCQLINLYGIVPSNGMIATFAFTIGARAIITLDTDFASLSDAIDVYMPREYADKCAVYEPSAD